MALTRLKQLREEAVLTVHELAEASGVSDDTISKIENGQRVARPNTLRKLARALNVSAQELRRPAKTEELAGAGKSEAQRKAGLFPANEENQLIHATALEHIAELWGAQLSRGQYDLETLGEMYMTAAVLAMNHDATIGKSRESLPSNFLEQLEAAEERFVAVDGQIWETLEKIRRGYEAPSDEVAKKRKEKEEERLQQLRGGKHARHA